MDVPLPTFHPKVIDDKKKSDSKSSSSTDNVIPLTVVATARENESNDELGSLQSRSAAVSALALERLSVFWQMLR